MECMAWYCKQRHAMIPLHLLSVVVVCRPLSAFTIIPSFVNPIPGHAFHPHHLPRQHRVAPFESSQSQTVSVSASVSASAANDEYNFDDGDDESLLKVVKRDQLEGLCDQLNLSKKGTKESNSHQEDFASDDAHRRLGSASPGSYSADGSIDGIGCSRFTAPRRPGRHTMRGGPRVRPPSTCGGSYRHAGLRRAPSHYPCH